MSLRRLNLLQARLPLLHAPTVYQVRPLTTEQAANPRPTRLTRPRYEYVPPVSEASSVSTSALLRRVNDFGAHKDKKNTPRNAPQTDSRHAKAPFASAAEELDAYFLLRQRGPAQLARIRPAAFYHLADMAGKIKSARALDRLAEDAVEAFAADDYERASQLRHLLATAAGLPGFPRARILAMLRTLELTGLPMHLSPDTLVALASAPSAERDVDRAILKLLQPVLLSELRRRHRLKGGPRAEPMSIYSTLIWGSYTTILRLTQLDLKEQALDVIQAATEMGIIPMGATLDPLRGSANFQTVVFVTVVRSCMHWNWSLRAMNLIRELLRSHEGLDPGLHEFVVDVMFPLLEDCPSQGFEECSEILASLIRRGRHTGTFMPSRLLRQFYDKAIRLNHGKAAAAVFDAAEASGHGYAPPAGKGMIWLLQYLIGLNNMQQARLLLAAVVDQNVPIPLHHRGRVIATAAQNGFARSARALWERYAEREDAEMVVGHAGAMLRLVSLFVSISRDAAARLPDEFGDRVEEPQTLAEVRGPHAHIHELQAKARALKLAGAQGGTAARTTGPGHEVGFSDASPFTQGGGGLDAADESVPSSDVSAGRIDMVASSNTSQPRDGGASSRMPPEYDAIAERAHDCARFAQCVVDAFRASRMPLGEAPHGDLNALARAHIILGDFAGAFELFRTLLRRREVPDMHDINVSLTAMAEASPRGAAGWIKRMLAKGMEPDRVTFGTVIHHAFLHRDLDLVRWLVDTSRELGYERLTVKATADYIRGNIESRRGDAGALEEALEAMRTHGRELGWPNLGEFCANAALEADLPGLAFEFWALGVKGKTEWKDHEQRVLRQRIGNALRVHMGNGRLDGRACSEMVSSLRID